MPWGRPTTAGTWSTRDPAEKSRLGSVESGVPLIRNRKYPLNIRSSKFICANRGLGAAGAPNTFWIGSLLYPKHCGWQVLVRRSVLCRKRCGCEGQCIVGGAASRGNFPCFNNVSGHPAVKRGYYWNKRAYLQYWQCHLRNDYVCLPVLILSCTTCACAENRMATKAQSAQRYFRVGCGKYVGRWLPGPMVNRSPRTAAEHKLGKYCVGCRCGCSFPSPFVEG